MRTRRLQAYAALGLLAAGPGLAQPLSAIDWLTDSVTVPPRVDPGTGAPAPAGSVTANGAISVQAIGKRTMDGLGLAPVAGLGLADTLWQNADPRGLVRLLSRTQPHVDAPATRDLLVGLLTASALPPAGIAVEGEFLLARVDKLLELGELDLARRLIEQADLQDARLFRRWFDISLLQGTEDTACQRLQASPDLAPTFPATIFCLARAGDWDAAALTLDTAEALNLITPAEDALLLRFLDETNAEEQGPLTLPNQITPLMLRLYDAVGEPIPTEILPRAFAHADLAPQNGWKAQLTAAERLVAAGSIPGAQLFALYRAQAPAASGGVWDRAQAVQALDAALAGGDTDALAEALPRAWSALSPLHLGHAFAEEYGRDLMARGGHDLALARRIALLSPAARQAAERVHEGAPLHFLAQLSLGRTPLPPAPDRLTGHIREGFGDGPLPASLELLLSEGRTGEAALMALGLFSTGADGDGEDLIHALRLMRAIGLEDFARRAALSVAVQERRG